MYTMAQFLKAYLVCQLVFLQLTVVFSKIQIEPRIVGGARASIEEIPFLVQIWYFGNFICGGTLTTGIHIVTAAHCVSRKYTHGFNIVVNATRLDESVLHSSVDEIIIHPNYNYLNSDQDVAVMKLKARVKGPFPIIPWGWGLTIKPGDMAQLYGWGAPSADELVMSKQLQNVAVKIISNNECEHKYEKINHITENMFCAAAPGKDGCRGDSGGPVLVNGRVVGIISWGIGCAKSTYPGVYANFNSPSILKFFIDTLLPYEFSEYAHSLSLIETTKETQKIETSKKTQKIETKKKRRKPKRRKPKRTLYKFIFSINL